MIELAYYTENPELRESAKEAVDYFNKEMAKIFGDDYVYIARQANSIGFMLGVQFANLTKDYKRTSVSFLNAPAKHTFIMHLSKNSRADMDSDKPVKWELSTRNHESKAAGINYRMISAKNPLDATKKLVEWFKKNKPLFDKLPRTNT